MKRMFKLTKTEGMRALGTEIIHTPREDGMLGAAEKADKIKRSIPGAISLEQLKIGATR